MTEPCAHNFCHACISKLSSGVDNWLCPECSLVQFKQPDDLARNRFAEKAVEAHMSSQNSQHTKTPCSNIDEQTTTAVESGKHAPTSASSSIESGLRFNRSEAEKLVNAILSAAASLQTPKCGASYLLLMAFRNADAVDDMDYMKVRILGTLIIIQRTHSNSEADS